MSKNFNVSGPAFLGLYVRDLATAAEFYEKKLGFRRDTEVNTWSVAVAFHSYPIPFAVIQAPPEVDLNGLPCPRTVPAIWLKTANSQVIHDALVADGVPILKPLSTGRLGRTFTFVDPEGYAINIYDRDTPPEGWDRTAWVRGLSPGSSDGSGTATVWQSGGGDDHGDSHPRKDHCLIERQIPRITTFINTSGGLI